MPMIARLSQALLPTARRLGCLLVLTVAACTDPGPRTGPGTPVAEPTADPNALVWALSEAPAGLDPARMTIDPGGWQVAAQAYDRLFRFRQDGSFQLAPGIAADWDVDLGGKTYTFVLRDGLRFHDGTPLDAPAVKWNFDRWMDPRHEGHHGDFLAWQSFFGGFVGQVDEGSGRAFNLVERVQALDRGTVRVTLREPFAPFPYHLATLPFSLASPTAIRAQGAEYGTDGEHLPVGSGPFRVQRWDKATGGVRLVPFPGHWTGAPAAPAIEMTAIPDDDARLAALSEGVVHGAEFSAGARVPAVVPGLASVPRPARQTAWLMLNHQRAPLDNPRIREALALAVDRTALARDQFGPFALPAAQLLPPGFPGHDQAILPREHDLARAKELLAEAGAEEGFRLNIWVPTTERPYLPQPRGTAETLAAMLREAGIDARVRTDTLRRFLSSRDTGRYTAWIVGWQLQSPDPDNAWYWHFSPARVAAEGQYVNEGLFQLLLDAQRTISSDLREEMYFSAAQTLRAESPRIFLAHARDRVLLSPDVRGFAPGPMGFDDLSVVSVAAAAGVDSLGEAPTPAAGTPAPTSTSAPSPESTVDPDGEGDDDDDDDGDEDEDEDEEENGATDDDDATGSAEEGASETRAVPSATTTAVQTPVAGRDQTATPRPTTRSPGDP